jgi:hypothetical protein
MRGCQQAWAVGGGGGLEAAAAVSVRVTFVAGGARVGTCFVHEGIRKTSCSHKDCKGGWLFANFTFLLKVCNLCVTFF